MLLVGNIAPLRPSKILLQIGARFLVQFQLQLCRFGGSKMTPKSTQQSTSAPKGAQRPPGSPSGFILKQPGTHFRASPPGTKAPRPASLTTLELHFGSFLCLPGASFAPSQAIDPHLTTSPLRHHSSKLQGAGGMGAKPLR